MMQNDSAAILDLARPEVSGRGARVLLWPMAAAVGILALLMGALMLTGLAEGALAALGKNDHRARVVSRIDLDVDPAIPTMTVDDKTQIIAEGTIAEERNAMIPFLDAPVQSAKAFALGKIAAAEVPTALKCLTQAVYYEAAFEPLSGRRAVAQVVLNRMRHPAYPKSVCGVVYQGSERRTGCQFSFTCDGALLRAPAIGPWREAEAVAKAALSGYVERSVGTATHYHADYVLPKWAFTLGKINQIGRHIFYRFNGTMGRPGAFVGRYAGFEQIPALNFQALRLRLAEAAAPAGVFDAAGAGLSVEPHIADRHAAADIGGRIDVTKEWRLNIPDPVQASAHYRAALEKDGAPAVEAAPASQTTHIAAATDLSAVKQP